MNAPWCGIAARLRPLSCIVDYTLCRAYVRVVRPDRPGPAPEGPGPLEHDISAVTVVTSLNGHVALVDRDGQIAYGPVDPADEQAWTGLTGWLRGYILNRV